MLALILAVAAAAQLQTQDPLASRVDSIMAQYNRTDGPGVQVAVIKDGRIVLERGYGLAQLEHDVKITPATVFHVASVSKQFTAFAIVLLAQQGKLGLDDDIRKHLTELSEFPHKVTVRQLVHHTSGVRDQWELAMMAGWRMDDVITRDQIMNLMKRQRELNFEPGSEHLYSNMGYSLLAEIVERASGMKFGEFLHANVFQPLGMNSTHVHNDHQMVVRNRAYSYVRGPGDSWRNAVLSYANQGATSLFTTAGDLARWLHNFETAQVGRPAAIKQMRERGVLNKGDTIPYAFAIARGTHRGREHWSHSGGDAGFRSYVVHFPNERLGIVVLSNAANAAPPPLAFRIADVYLGESTPVAQTNPPPTQQRASNPAGTWNPTTDELRALAGDYYSPELRVIYSVELRGTELWAVHRQGETRLRALEKDAFAGPRNIRFVRDATGAVNGFRLTGGRVRNIQFFRLAQPLPVIKH